MKLYADICVFQERVITFQASWVLVYLGTKKDTALISK